MAFAFCNLLFLFVTFLFSNRRLIIGGFRGIARRLTAQSAQMIVEEVIQTIWKMRDKLFRFSLKILDSRSEAEDVVQEVYFKVLNKLSDVEGVINPEAWCMTLTKNLSLDKLKSKHRRVNEISEAATLSETSDNPMKRAELLDTVAHVKRLIKSLPEKQRDVIHLRDVEQMSYEEIVDILHIPLSQVKINLHRARSAIRMQMIELDK